MKMLEGLQDMMSAITFIQFIEEEAIQSAALGTFLALRHGSNRGAALGIAQTRVICDHLKLINDNLGWAAPYSKGCFQDFLAATLVNLDIYDDILLIKGRTKQ